MIGFYNYTVYMTYLGLVSSVIGMFMTYQGNYKVAVFCLALSGFCDMLDGKIARTKKDRTEEEKVFGIQIDSLCDVICFGVFPALLAFSLGMNGIVGIVILILYVVNAVIRLGFFNVMEEERQKQTTEKREYYRGLPVTSISIVMPLTLLIGGLVKIYFLYLLHICMACVGALFIIDFKVKKPSNAVLAVIVIVVGLTVMKLLHWI